MITEGRHPHLRAPDDLAAAYAALLASGELDRRARAAGDLLSDCHACPRDCGADRLAGELGFCRTAAAPLVASAQPHHGEEAPLVGRRGSGTIFFGWCNLHCVFCQNADLSQRADGVPVSPAELADLMLRLEAWGCHNINLVTPSHVVPQILAAVADAAGRGLSVPLVYNSSGYDRVETLRLLDGIVDIYMPDFKYWEPRTAERLSGAADYPARARAALREMHRQVGDLRLDSRGIARRGLLVRHLVMPGLLFETREIVRWLAAEISPDTYLNVMDQYRPLHRVLEERLRGAPAAERRYSDLDRPLAPDEHEAAVEAARQAGLWRLDGLH
jgi:putative pyruvate formate lyase activating enzyme